MAIDMISAGKVPFANEQSLALSKDNISMLLAQGMDTTGSALAFLVYNLATNQEVQDKLRREIQDTIGDGPVNQTNLEKMPYLTACIKENFRRFPISHTNLRITGTYFIKKFVRPVQQSLLCTQA